MTYKKRTWKHLKSSFPIVLNPFLEGFPYWDTTIGLRHHTVSKKMIDVVPIVYV